MNYSHTGHGDIVWGQGSQRLKNLEILQNEYGHGKFMENEKLAKCHGVL